jgi:hypothetical protein
MRKAVLIIACLIPVASPAAVYRVEPGGDGDVPTIADALAAAQDGDIIELGDGVFTGRDNINLEFMGKALTVRSASGDAARCVIDVAGVPGGEVERGFIFQWWEGPASVLRDLSIVNAMADGP